MPVIGLSAGTLVVSTEGSALTATPCTEALLQADPSNTATVFLGTSAAQPLKLSAGLTVTVPVSNLANLTAKTSAGSATVNWLANGVRF